MLNSSNKETSIINFLTPVALDTSSGVDSLLVSTDKIKGLIAKLAELDIPDSCNTLRTNLINEIASDPTSFGFVAQQYTLLSDVVINAPFKEIFSVKSLQFLEFIAAQDRTVFKRILQNSQENLAALANVLDSSQSPFLAEVFLYVYKIIDREQGKTLITSDLGTIASICDTLLDLEKSSNETNHVFFIERINQLNLDEELLDQDRVSVRDAFINCLNNDHGKFFETLKALIADPRNYEIALPQSALRVLDAVSTSITRKFIQVTKVLGAEENRELCNFLKDSRTSPTNLLLTLDFVCEVKEERAITHADFSKLSQFLKTFSMHEEVSHNGDTNKIITFLTREIAKILHQVERSQVNALAQIVRPAEYCKQGAKFAHEVLSGLFNSLQSIFTPVNGKAEPEIVKLVVDLGSNKSYFTKSDGFLKMHHLVSFIDNLSKGQGKLPSTEIKKWVNVLASVEEKYSTSIFNVPGLRADTSNLAKIADLIKQKVHNNLTASNLKTLKAAIPYVRGFPGEVNLLFNLCLKKISPSTVKAIADFILRVNQNEVFRMFIRSKELTVPVRWNKGVSKIFIAGMALGKSFEDLQKVYRACCKASSLNWKSQAERNLLHALKNKDFKDVSSLTKAILNVHANVTALKLYRAMKNISPSEWSSSKEVAQLWMSFTSVDENHLPKTNAEMLEVFSYLELWAGFYDIFQGFSAKAFDSRRFPTKDQGILAEFGNSFGKLEIFNVRNNDIFPGKGYAIHSLNLEKVFAVDKSAEDPFAPYKAAWPHLAQAFSDLPQCTIYELRGMTIIKNNGGLLFCDQNSYIHYSFRTYNEHFPNFSDQTVFLEQTSQIQSLRLERYLSPMEDYLGYNQTMPDLSEALKSPNSISEKSPHEAFELGDVRNLAGGAILRAVSIAYKDEFEFLARYNQRLKRWNGEGMYSMSAVDRTNGNWLTRNRERAESIGDLLRDLGEIPVFDQEHLSEMTRIAKRYKNVFDLYKIALAYHHKGYTAAPSSEVQDFNDTAQESEYEIELSSEPTVNASSFKMLDYAYKWHALHENGVTDRNSYPLIIITDALHYSLIPEKFPYIDTWDMVAHINGQSYQLSKSERTIDDEIFWAEHFFPLAADTANSLKDIRPVSRASVGIS